MWLRFGRWVEVGVHFGRQNARLERFDRHFVLASLRVGKREWTYGSDRLVKAVHLPLDSFPSLIDLYPDPEPLRWGVRKHVTISHPTGRNLGHVNKDAGKRTGVGHLR